MKRRGFNQHDGVASSHKERKEMELSAFEDGVGLSVLEGEVELSVFEDKVEVSVFEDDLRGS